jgi:hypothetical protein
LLILQFFLWDLVKFWRIFAGILSELGKMRALLCWVFCAWILLLLGARRCSVFVSLFFF